MEEGFCVMILECPKGEVIFDNMKIKVGELFKGIKSVPFGVHLLGSDLKIGKSSVFIHSLKKSVFVFKWHSESEEFRRVEPEDEEMYEGCLEELSPMMIEYEKDSLNSWKELTCYIDESVIDRIQPLSRQILSTQKEYQGNEECEPFNGKNLLYYSTIPKRFAKPNMTQEELTRFNYDKTQIFNELLSKEYKGYLEILGEFQFAFVSFLISENFESFDQWKNLMVLLCNCEEGLKTHKEFFINFIPVLYSQIKNLPKDLVFDPFLAGSFISSCLKAFMQVVNDRDLDPVLQSRGAKLINLLKDEFAITEIEMMDDEDAPVICYD